MNYDDLRDQPLEHYLNQVQGLAAMATQTQVQSLMAVTAKCTVDLADQLASVSRGLDETRSQFDRNISELNKQLLEARAELRTASGVASSQSRALVSWSKALVVVTAIYTLLTGGLLWVQAHSLWKIRTESVAPPPVQSSPVGATTPVRPDTLTNPSKIPH